MIKFTKLFSLASLFGHTLFFVIVLSEHFLRTELPPLSHYLSEYSLGPLGWIHVSAFFILGVSQLFLFAALVLNIRASILSLVTFIIYTLGIFMVIIYPADEAGVMSPTTSGLIHGYAALITFTSFAISVIAWGFNFKRDKNWQATANLTFLLGVIGIFIFITSFFAPPSLGGFFQRCLVVCNLTWLITISKRMFFFP